MTVRGRSLSPLPLGLCALLPICLLLLRHLDSPCSQPAEVVGLRAVGAPLWGLLGASSSGQASAGPCPLPTARSPAPLRPWGDSIQPSR